MDGELKLRSLNFTAWKTGPRASRVLQWILYLTNMLLSGADCNKMSTKYDSFAFIDINMVIFIIVCLFERNYSRMLLIFILALTEI